MLGDKLSWLVRRETEKCIYNILPWLAVATTMICTGSESSQYMDLAASTCKADAQPGAKVKSVHIITEVPISMKYGDSSRTQIICFIETRTDNVMGMAATSVVDIMREIYS